MVLRSFLINVRLPQVVPSYLNILIITGGSELDICVGAWENPSDVGRFCAKLIELFKLIFKPKFENGNLISLETLVIYLYIPLSLTCFQNIESFELNDFADQICGVNSFNEKSMFNLKSHFLRSTLSQPGDFKTP